jgi:hypothetical protein
MHAPSPNPVAGRAVFRYELPEGGAVRLVLYDAIGRTVAALVDGERPAGVHEAVLHAGRLAPGVYVARLSGDGGEEVRLVTVVR